MCTAPSNYLSIITTVEEVEAVLKSLLLLLLLLLLLVVVVVKVKVRLVSLLLLH
jgi:hypothetical protein